MAFCPRRIVDRYVEVPVEKIVERFREVCAPWSICCGLWLGTKRGSSCNMPRFSTGSMTQQYRVQYEAESVCEEGMPLQVFDMQLKSDDFLRRTSYCIAVPFIVHKLDGMADQ